MYMLVLLLICRRKSRRGRRGRLRSGLRILYYDVDGEWKRTGFLSSLVRQLDQTGSSMQSD
jgi:hypothetical protein